MELIDFKTVYKAWHRKLWYYCNNLLWSNHIQGHWELAEDFVQEVFIEAYKRWDTFEGESNVKSFMFLCAKNRCFNKIEETHRRWKSHKEIAFLSSEAELPDYLAMNADIIGFISKEVERLPPQCSAIVKLYFKGLSSHEIAAKLHINRKTALNQKLKGIDLLKRKLHLKFG
jgi:RNA polymerase sigma factor (sigma-70 family)